MPSPTRPATPGPSNNAKRAMSDSESASQDPKKARRDPSAAPTARRDASRDPKRRKRKKKAPIVGVADAKGETAPARPDEPSRVPLSARNDVVRVTSLPPVADQPASVLHDTDDPLLTLPPTQLSKSLAHSLTADVGVHRCDSMPSTPKDGKRSTAISSPGPSRELEDKVAKLEAELKSKNNLIASHHALLNQVHQAVTCQVCLDLMYKPYALAPCGHLACHSCLVSWFTAPPPDNRPAHPAITRRKTCPHCRAIVRERPVEVWGVKSIAQTVGKSGLLQNQLPAPAEVSESLDPNADPWQDIFPRPGSPSHRGLPWFFPGADIDDDDIDIPDGAPRGEDVGMLDVEDGGIYRCLDCMHEIWDGVCSSCGRVYPGHRPGRDEQELEENAMGWLEDQMGAEEVDVADDPGWMGLESGEADDDGGDMDDWRPLDPWRRRFHMFRGPWGFLGTIHVDEEDEEEEQDDVHAHVDDLRVPEEESADEGYESSFIDDDDNGGGTAHHFDGPRFYEISDEEDHHGRDQASDEDEGAVDAREHARIGRRCATAVVSPDVDADDLEDSPWSPVGQHPQGGRRRRGHGIVESDGSDSSRSDE